MVYTTYLWRFGICIYIYMYNPIEISSYNVYSHGSHGTAELAVHFS